MMRRTKSTRSAVAVAAATRRDPGFGLKRALSQRLSAREQREQQQQRGAGAEPEPMRADLEASELRRKQRSAYYETTQRVAMPYRIRPVEEFDWDSLRVDNPHDKSQPSLAPTRTQRVLSKLRNWFKP